MNNRAKDDPSRTTAMGLLTDAKEMLAAARILHESGGLNVLNPTYYLLGHAIEVALKSFLLAGGEDLERVRNYNHNIGKTAKKVIAANHDSMSTLVQEHLEEIQWLNLYYKAKEFEYRVTGMKSYPPKERLFAFLQACIPLIEPIALQALKERRA